jgi:CheY-like chemotaxis protein
MPKNKVLILDDENIDLALHKFFLEQAGLESICTNSSKEAVEIALTNFDIKIVLVDEILWVYGKIQDQTQDWQGEDVRAEIRKQRKDVHFIIITSKAEIKATEAANTGDISCILQVWNEIDTQLRREPQVAGVFHKQRLRNPTQQRDEYDFLIKLIKELLQDKRSLPNSQIKTIEIPSLFIGVGVPPDLLNEIDDKGNERAFRYKTVRNYLRNQAQGYKPSEAEIDRQVKKLQKEFQSPTQRTIEKKIFFVKPGDNLSKRQELTKKIPGKKKHQPIIKPGTRPFEILEWLAWKAESRQTPPIIDGEEFLYDIQGKSRLPSGEGKTSISSLKNEQKQASMEFIKTNPREFHNLTVALDRVYSKLIEANIGFDSRQQLLRCYDGETKYEALFDTGIILYGVTSEE